MSIGTYLTPLRVAAKAGEAAAQMVTGLETAVNKMTPEELALASTGLEAMVSAYEKRTGDTSLEVVEAPVEQVEAQIEVLEKLAPIADADPEQTVTVDDQEIRVADVDLSDTAVVEKVVDVLPASDSVSEEIVAPEDAAAPEPAPKSEEAPQAETDSGASSSDASSGAASSSDGATESGGEQPSA